MPLKIAYFTDIINIIIIQHLICHLSLGCEIKATTLKYPLNFK